jgi:hypothetical protein
MPISIRPMHKQEYLKRKEYIGPARENYKAALIQSSSLARLQDEAVNHKDLFSRKKDWCMKVAKPMRRVSWLF